MKPLQLIKPLYVEILSGVYILLLAISPALAQDQIIFHRGEKLTGKIIEEQPNKIIFQTDKGTIGIPRKDIRDIITPQTLSFVKGEACYRKGQYKIALKHYQAQLSQYPQTQVSEETLYKIGLCYLKIGDYTASIETFSAYLEKYLEGNYTVSAIYEIGNIHYLQKSYSKAISSYETLLNKHPDSKLIRLALYKIAKSYLATGDKDKAIEHFQELITRFPESKIAADASFFLLKCKPEPDSVKLVEAYKSYISTYPSSHRIPEAIASLSELYFQQNLYSEFADYILELKGQKVPYSSHISYYLALSRWKYLKHCVDEKKWQDYRAVKADYLNQIFDETEKVVKLSPNSSIAIDAQYLNWQVHDDEYDDMEEQAYQKLFKMLSTYCKRNRDPAKLKEIADRFYQENEYDYAKELYQEYATKIAQYFKPVQSIPILISVTKECLEKRGLGIEIASKIYEIIVNKFPISQVGEEIYERLTAFYFHHDKKKGISLCKRFLKEFPESKEYLNILYRLALCYYIDTDNWSVEDYNELTMSSKKMPSKVKKYQDFEIRWYFWVMNKSGNWINAYNGQDNKNVYQSTEHKAVYLTYSTPRSPMDKPWVDVLNYSCVWADGTGSVRGVSEKLTNAIYFSSGLNYFGGGSHTSGTNDFNLTLFLEHLTTTPWADCRDCANFFEITCKSLGVKAKHKTLDGLDTHVFYTNYINPIGTVIGPWPNEWGRTTWNFHQVGWLSQRVYDPCLQVDKDDDPESLPCEGLLPVRMKQKEYDKYLLAPGESYNMTPVGECTVH